MKPLTLRLLAFCTLGIAGPLSAVLPPDLHKAAQEIDARLATHWQSQKTQGNAPASDEVFVRRVYLDLTGRIPTVQEAQAFLASTDPAKRTKLIDQLLTSDGYTQHMFNFWADILRVQSRANGGQGEMTSKPYLEYVRKQIRENKPYDQFVRDLLSAKGKVWENPAIGYYMRDLGMPLDNLSNTARIFLGTRIECAQCHDHPFDKWTQMQFYQMAAYTYPLETNYTGISGMDGAMEMKRQAEWTREKAIKKGTDDARAKAQHEATVARWVGKALDDLGDFVRYSKVKALDKRQLKLPHDYAYKDSTPHAVVEPATMLGNPAECTPGTEKTVAYAAWMTSPDNPRFTKVIANRLWKKAFGLGLIEPVDELMDSTVAVNPALMAYLEQLMKDLRYDTRAYLRVLYNTQTYQREATRREIPPGEAYAFTGPVLRRMTAEQIWDSFVTLVHVTPDLPRRQGIDSETSARIAYRAKLSDALDTLSSQELFDGAMASSRAYEAISARAKPLREEYTAAQKAKDKEKIQKLGEEIRSLEFVARSSVNDHLVVPAVARLYTQKTNAPAPPPIVAVAQTGGDSMMMTSSKKAGQQRQYIAIPGYEPGNEEAEAEAAAEKSRVTIYREEARHLRIPDGEVDKYIANRQQQAREWMRAAYLDSPSPRGHYLREFGQSDRDLIENANYDASMPQALVLMNSTLFQQIIQPRTQLSLGIAAASTPDAQLEAAYLAILSRKPTAQEKAAWQKAKGAGLQGTEDLIYALLNTQQFIFVQ